MVLPKERVVSEQVQIEISVRTNKVGSESKQIIQFDKEDWDDMGGDERQELMLEELFNMIDWDWNPV
jgi:hypothetical protein